MFGNPRNKCVSIVFEFVHMYHVFVYEKDISTKGIHCALTCNVFLCDKHKMDGDQYYAKFDVASSWHS